MSAATRRTLVVKIAGGKVVEVLVDRPGFVSGRLSETAPKTGAPPSPPPAKPVAPKPVPEA